MGSQVLRQTGKTVLVVGEPEITEILRVNLAHANFEIISVQNGAEALTKACRERPDLILLDAILPDMDSLDVCRQLKRAPLASQIPVIIISANSEIEDRIEGITAGAEAYITKPFDPSQVVALAEACFKRLEGMRNANPLTRLPNRTQVDDQITALIRQNKIFAAIYVDIGCFKAFNHVYGFYQGDYAIQLLAEIIRETVQLFGNPDDLVGHLGGDDFVAISTPQKAQILCQRIIAEFDNRIRILYNQHDLERGYIECEGRLGQRLQYPIMSLSIAVVTSEKRIFNNHLQVSEIATELRDYLIRFPGSNYCFDRREYSIKTPAVLDTKGTPLEHRQEKKSMQGMLAWVAFLFGEIEPSIKRTKDCLESLLKSQGEDSDADQLSNLEAMQENINQQLRILAELENLKNFEQTAGTTSLKEIDLRKTFDWIKAQLQVLAEQHTTEIDTDGVEDVGPLVVDGVSLTQGLFYLLRSEIKASAPGDRIHVRVSEASEALVSIEIINHNRFIPPSEMVMLFRGGLENLISLGMRNDLYLAKVAIHGLGGKIKVKSRKKEGSVFTIFVPRRWFSSAEEINRLQSEIERNFRAARSQLQRVHYLLQSTIEYLPSNIAEGLESISSMLQQLELLFNRSLFLADDLNNELESKQGRLLQQEVEQLTASEAMLTINREMARLADAKYLFDLESAKRVAKNAVAVADELKLSRSERQTLYCAALLKDLRLVSDPHEIFEDRIASSLEKESNLGVQLSTVKKALSQLTLLAPVLSLAQQRYEGYDGTGRLPGLKGAKIPMAAEILAIVDTFDASTSGSHGQTLEPEAAVRKIAADAGHRFNPEVVSAFIQVWRRTGLNVASSKASLEV